MSFQTFALVPGIRGGVKNKIHLRHVCDAKKIIQNKQEENLRNESLDCDDLYTEVSANRSSEKYAIETD